MMQSFWNVSRNAHTAYERWRELLFSTPGLSQYISGIIVFDETLRSTAPDGTLLRDKITSAGIILGVKVDIGTSCFPGSRDGETATLGLDNLAQRCKEYYALGCRFAKWRAVHKISSATPSAACVQENAWSLARYGAPQERQRQRQRDRAP
jgi:fructose-bisphosphate aldolase class I